MAQNWNNLLTYIKHELGVPSNLIEMTDAEITSNILHVVMPDFSQYMGKNMLYALDQSMALTTTGSASAYKLPLVANDGIEITRIQNAYYGSASSGLAASINNTSSGLSTNPSAMIMSTVYADALASLAPIRSYVFNKPDVIMFTSRLAGSIIIELDVVHTNPNTIPGDLYHKSFKKMCLLSIIEGIVAIRSKYTSVQTPIGEVALNIDFLISKADRLRDEIKEVNNDIPPDPLLAFVI